MKATEMEENRRRYSRLSTKLKAQYLLEGEKGWKGCTIINLSHEGMCITFQTHEKINVGSNIHLNILVSTESETINVKGILKWVETRENDFIGGIEWRIINRGEIIK